MYSTQHPTEANVMFPDFGASVKFVSKLSQKVDQLSRYVLSAPWTKALQDMYTTLTNRMQQNTAETNESQAILEAQVQQIAAGCNESLAILEDQVQRVTAGCNESHAILEDRARDQNTASEAKLIENTIISVMRELLPLIMAAHRSQDGPQEDIGKKQDKKGDRVAKKGRVGSGTRSSQKPKPTRQGGHRSGPESATPRAHNTRSGGRP